MRKLLYKVCIAEADLTDGTWVDNRTKNIVAKDVNDAMDKFFDGDDLKLNKSTGEFISAIELIAEVDVL